MPLEKLVADADKGHPLAGVAEDLRRRHQQDVIVRIAGHGGHERRLPGMSQVAAIVHAEIGQVFHHDSIVAGSQFADHRQLALFQTGPGRVVGIRIDDGRHVAGGEFLLEPRTQFLPPPGVNVEGFPAEAQDPQLRLLDGEARVQEQDLVLAGDPLAAGCEGAEGTGHGTHGGDAATRLHIDIDKGLHETAGGLFQFRNPVGGRIL